MSQDRSKEGRGSPERAGPKLSEKGRRAQYDQKAREAAALRQNLARRKQQQRARAANPATPAPTPPIPPPPVRDETDEHS